jgi:hypothetical protein
VFNILSEGMVDGGGSMTNFHVGHIQIRILGSCGGHGGPCGGHGFQCLQWQSWVWSSVWEFTLASVIAVSCLHGPLQWARQISCLCPC